MKLLLDTISGFRASSNPKGSVRKSSKSLRTPKTSYGSLQSVFWETMVLAEKGRIILQPDPETWVRTALSKAPMKEAPINTEVTLLSRKICLPHQDPSDRFIVATASVFGLTLVTEDRKLHEIEGVQILSTRPVTTR